MLFRQMGSMRTQISVVSEFYPTVAGTALGGAVTNGLRGHLLQQVGVNAKQGIEHA